MEPVKVPPSSDVGIRNPFRRPMMRKQFDALVHCYVTKHRDLIRPSGAQHNGNTWAMNFWRGYNGVPRPRYDSLTDSPAYACWKAGKAIREKGL